MNFRLISSKLQKCQISTYISRQFSIIYSLYNLIMSCDKKILGLSIPRGAKTIVKSLICLTGYKKSWFSLSRL